MIVVDITVWIRDFDSRQDHLGLSVV